MSLTHLSHQSLNSNNILKGDVKKLPNAIKETKHILQILQMYGLDYAEKSKKLDFSWISFFSCYQQASPLGVYTYAFRYPKTKVLAQFVDSKVFSLSPKKIKAV